MKKILLLLMLISLLFLLIGCTMGAPGGVGLQTDSLTGAVEIIDFPHHEIHEGNHFFVKNWTDVNGAGTTYDIIIITPNSSIIPHIIWNFETENEFNLEVYLNTVISNNGTKLISWNNNLRSNNTAYLNIYKEPTISNIGTIMYSTKIGLNKRDGGDTRNDNELLLDYDTVYLFRFTKEVAGDGWINYFFTWYEFENK